MFLTFKKPWIENTEKVIAHILYGRLIFFSPKYLLQFRELGEDHGQLVVQCLLQEFDFARIECSNSADLPAFTHHRRRLSLRFGQNNILQVLKAKKNL